MKNRAEIEIQVQNESAIASINSLIGNIQGINRELITAKYGFETAFQVANQVIQATTGQAQLLEKQTLSLVGTFASLNQVFSSGVSLNDPLDKINALQPAIEASIRKVREISLAISGVTSSELTSLFQIIATNSGAANLSLDQSVSLVKNFAAGLTSLQIPLYQARQEIDSILKGQITQDSTLAKQLGVTNEIVAREKARNNLVEYLNERLKTSVAIQEKLSKTIEGVSSNIQEIGELAQSAFGGQLLKPITDTLNAFYGFLDTNKDKIFGFAEFLGNSFVKIGETLKVIFDAIAPRLAAAGDVLGSLATTSIQALTGAFAVLGNVIATVDSALNVALIPTLKLLNTDLGQAVIIGGLFAATINVGALGASLKFAESLMAVVVASGQYVVLTGVRIAAVISEIGINGVLDASLKQVLATRTALASAQMVSNSQAGLAILSGGLITVAVVAASAAVALSYFNRQNELFIEQNEKYSSMSDKAIDDSIKIVSSLKKIEEQRIKNGGLTKEEEADQVKKTKLAKIQIEENNAQIANIKEQIFWNEDLRKTLSPKINILEKENELLSNLKSLGLKVAPIGDAYSFLNQEATKALKTINSGVNQAEFDLASKSITDITKQQVELGLITRQQGIEQLEILSRNENVKVELRAAANKQILALIKDTNKEELELNKQKQSEQEQLAANGYISEGESLKKISELKKESLEIDATNARAANKKIAEDSARERFSTLSKAQKELDDLKNTKPTNDVKQDNATVKAIEEKRKEIAKTKENFDSQDLNNQRKFAGDEAKIRTDKLKAEQDDINKQVKYLRGVLDRELEENGNLRKKAEFATQADIQVLKLGGYKNELVLEEQTLLIKKQTIESELFDKRRSLEFDKTLLANFRGSQAEKEALIIKISKQELDVSKLNLDATDNLIARTKIIYDAKIKGIEQERESLEKTSKLLQSQNDLQSARIGLTKAVQDAELKSGENQLNNLKEVGALVKQNNDSARDKAKRGADEQSKANRDAVLADLAVSREAILSKLSDEEKAAKQKEFQAEDQAKAAVEAKDNQAKAEAEAKNKQAKEDATNAQKSILTKQRLIELGFSASTSELEIARQTFAQEEKNLELKARQFEANQANEQRSLLISQQQAEIKDRQLATEAKLALLRAQETGKTDLIASALELVNLTGEQIKNNKELAKVQTETLNVKQKSDRDTFNEGQSSATFKNKIAGVEAGLTAGQVIDSGSKNNQAQAVKAAPIADEKEATKTIKANQKENIKKTLDERSQVLADVGKGAVAFEDTTEQVAKNFDKLPKSLKATADGLKEVISFAKELGDNPLFASREEAKKKEADSKAKLQKQEKQEQEKPKGTTAVNNLVAEESDVRAKNQAITANNAKIVNRNELGKAANEIVFANTSLIGVGNQDEAEVTRNINRENDKKLLNDKKKIEQRQKAEAFARSSSGFFTGGIPPIDTPVTVNEQGQEAATNLRTGETVLLPYGERQVIFGDTTYIHNANDTRQLLTANTSSAQAIADSRNVDPQNNPVLDALGKIHDLIAGREAKLAVTNNFTNETQPDQRVYELTRAMMRAVAV